MNTPSIDADDGYSKTDRVILALHGNKLPMYLTSLARVVNMSGSALVPTVVDSLRKKGLVTREGEVRHYMYSMSDDQLKSLLKQRGIPKIMTKSESDAWRQAAEDEEKKARISEKEKKAKDKADAKAAKLEESKKRRAEKRELTRANKAKKISSKRITKKREKLTKQYEELLVEMGKAGIAPAIGCVRQDDDGFDTTKALAQLRANLDIKYGEKKVEDESDDDGRELEPLWRLRLNNCSQFTHEQKLVFLNRIKASPTIFSSSPILEDMILDYSPVLRPHKL